MAHIDNEFNKRFGNQQLPNDDFDTEGLWDAISDDLGNVQAAPDGYFLGGKWIIGLSLLLVIGGIIGMIYLTSDDTVITQKIENNIDNNTPNTIQNDAMITPSNSKENTSLNIQTNSESLNTTSIISQENESKAASHVTTHTGAPDTHTTPYSNNNTQKITSSKQTSFTENTPIPFTNDSNKTEGSDRPLISTNNSSKTLIGNEIKVNPTKPSNNNSVGNSTKTFIDNPVIDSPTISTKNSIEVSVAALPSIVALVESNSSNSSVLLASPTLEVPDNEQHKVQRNLPIKWQADLFGGINTRYTNHQSNDYSDLADLKNTTAKQDLGTSYGINAGLVFKDRWLLNSGIEYHQLWSKFDYEEIKQFQVLKEDVLLRIWVDAATGDTLNTLYGDTLVNAISTRTVLHYNQFQRVSIPLEIGVQQNHGKFLYGITAGTVFNFTNQQSGRTLDASGEIIDFSGNDATAPYKSFDIGLRVSPLVGYQLSENWSLTLRPQWTWNQNTNFDDTDIKIGFHQVNLNIGLRHSFK